MPGLAEVSRQPMTEAVVTRWLDAPPQRLDDFSATQMSLGNGDELRLDGAFQRTSDRALPTWRAPGRLVWHGPTLARAARVEIDVTKWGDDAAEVSVRPAGRRVFSWGPRRERRYFLSAHRAATHIARVVGAPEGDATAVERTSAA